MEDKFPNIQVQQENELQIASDAKQQSGLNRIYFQQVESIELTGFNIKLCVFADSVKTELICSGNVSIFVDRLPEATEAPEKTGK